MGVESEDVAILGLGAPIPRTSWVRHLHDIFMKWWREAQRLKSEAHVYYCAFKDPRTPWYAKIVAVCTAGYLFSPIQLIPNYIPFIGWLDDLAVLFLGAKLVQKLTPPEVLADCRESVKAAEERGQNQPKSLVGTIAFFVVAAIWLLVGIMGTALMVAHFRH